MKKKFIIFLAFWFLSAFGLVSAQERLDPHGVKSVDIHTINLKDNKSCTVCHIVKLEKVEVRPNLEQVCFNCHNKSPHSGVSEHQGKLWKSSAGTKEKINCQTCHASHRYGSLEAPEDGFFISKDRHLSAPFHVKSKPEAMLKRTCVECHKW